MKQEIHPDDIISCESEALHTIGHVQSHAYLIALHTETFKVDYCSENFFDLLASDKLALGLSLKELDVLLSNDSDQELSNLLAVSLKNDNLNVNNPYHILISEVEYNIILNKIDQYVIVEFEERFSNSDSFETSNLLGEILVKLSTSEISSEKGLQIAADQIKKMIGYDRVMVYKFYEDAHGEVIAESKNVDLGSFKGMHFPATDIPQQARELYVKNITRILVDVDSESVSIRSNKAENLDLTHCQTRAISLFHIEYLKNMGVKASYSISLIVDGKLWGLIACHNYRSSGFIDYEKRNATKVISQYLSNLIFAKQTIELQKNRELRFRAIDRIDLFMKEEWEVLVGLFKKPKLTLSVCEAEGFAIKYQDRYESYGLCPSEGEMDLIVKELKSDSTYGEVYATKNISSIIPEADKFAKTASGMIAAELHRDLGEYIIWFRPEFITKVSWGGKDDKEYIEDKDGKFRLSPRKSFAKWEESITNTAQPWIDADIDAVVLLRNKILSVIQHKANEIKRLNNELSAAYEELDSFSYTLSHDLKTPLNTIKGYLEIFEENLEEEQNPIVEKIMRNTDIMQEMVSNVLEYSKLGRSPINFVDVDIYQLVEEIKIQMVGSRKFDNVINNLPKGFTVSGNKMMLYQVLLNIIDNSIKYKNDRDDAFIKIGVNSYSAESVIIEFEDNGIGIETRHFDKVFGLFKRGDKANEVEGSGVGLAIVKKIINKHEGRVWVESKKGEGSTFFVQLKK